MNAFGQSSDVRETFSAGQSLSAGARYEIEALGRSAALGFGAQAFELSAAVFRLTQPLLGNRLSPILDLFLFPAALVPI